MDRVTRLVWLVLVLTLVASSCTCRGGDRRAGASPEAGVDAGEPRRGGVLTTATSLVPGTFDPIVTDENRNIWTQLLVFDQLVRVRKDGRGVEPALAESWDISPDGRVYTFQLRRDLKFSDGSPLRASDVKFSLNRCARDPLTIHGPVFPPFELGTPDDRTVVLTLQTPWPAMLADLSLYGASILPEGYFKQVGPEAFGQTPIGSGPFLVAEWTREAQVVLRRNPHHWDSRYPYVDEVRLIQIDDDNTRVLKVQAGEADVALGVPFNQVEMLQRAPGLKVQSGPVMGTDMLLLNARVSEFKDVKVRQAIHWAIDREVLIRGILFGNGEVPTSFLPRMLYVNSQDPPYRHDLAKAKQLLSESGYPNGFSTKLVIVLLPQYPPVAVVLKSQLAALGIQVEIQQLEANEYIQRLKRGDYGMALFGYSSDIIDPSQLVDAIAGSAHEFSKGRGYKNPKVDELAAQAKTEMNPARRAEIYLEIQRIVRDEALMIGLFWGNVATAVRDNVHDFAVLPTANYRLWEVWKSP